MERDREEIVMKVEGVGGSGWEGKRWEVNQHERREREK